MRKEEILNMPAGDEIDILVGENVMGWHKYWDERIKCFLWHNKENKSATFVSGSFFHDWSPSTDIEAAWEVVDKAVYFELSQPQNYEDKSWYCAMALEGTRTHDAQADTAPLAICRAALLAVMDLEDA